MIATERRGRLARISDLNLATIEAEARDRQSRRAPKDVRTNISPVLIKIGLLTLASCLVISLTLCLTIAIRSPARILDYAKTSAQWTAGIEAQALRDQAAKEENQALLFHEQALKPNPGANSLEDPEIIRGVWLKQAGRARAMARMYRGRAIAKERISQGWAPVP